MSRYKEIDLSKLQRYSIDSRASKVDAKNIAKMGKVSLTGLLESMPNVLKAKELQNLISDCKIAKDRERAIMIGLGGHVIKCGLSPLLIEMMEAGFVDCFMVNGSVAIHDFEIAMYGHTSEDVSTALKDGSFGMSADTADGINTIIKQAMQSKEGIGEAIGAYLLQHARNPEISLFAMAAKHNIPVCVHVAIGTDIIHQHPSADGAAIGDCSMRDFRILCERIKDLNNGGVYLNFGSAVILPEVFLKALTVARNIYHEVDGFSTAVFDMNMHYRPMENVVKRPTQDSGNGYYFVGHHEIMIPLFIKSLLYSD